MLKKICNILFMLILIGLISVAGLLVVPQLLGYQRLAVLSGSMEPGIGVGSIVYVKEKDSTALEVGDVITYKLGGDTLVTHRIVEILEEERCVITQGDANEVPDGSPIPYDNIVGCVDFHVPLLGYVSMYVKTPAGIGAVCVVLGIMIILGFLPDIIKGK